MGFPIQANLGNRIVKYKLIGYSRATGLFSLAGKGFHKEGGNMVEEIGFRILIPIFVFSIIVVGAYMISDGAFQDVLRRRKEEEGSK